MIFLESGFRGESGPSSLDSHQLEREIARERRISGGGNFDVASSVKERRVSGSVQGGLRERRVSGDVVEGGNVDDGKNVEVERKRQMPSSPSSSGDVIEGGRERRMSGKSLLRVASSNSINLRFCSSPNNSQKK